MQLHRFIYSISFFILSIIIIHPFAKGQFYLIKERLSVMYNATTFSFDPDGHFIFPLTVWITEMRFQSFLGIDFSQQQVSGTHFDLPGTEMKNHPKPICSSNFQQNKIYSHLEQNLTHRNPYTTCIDAKKDHC